MTYVWHDPKVGDIVYEAYTPTKAGKVIKVTPGEFESRLVVRKVDGSTFGIDSITARCYETLVEGHVRKAKKQGAILLKLRQI